MNSAILTISCILFFLAGYKFYSKYLSEKIFELSNDEKTPAHNYRDNIDYVPTNKHILFGHHFTSIAGALNNWAMHSSVLGLATSNFMGCFRYCIYGSHS